MDKFLRNYSLQVINPFNITQPETTVLLPFTIEFDVQRTKFTAANTASIRVYNLGAATRNLLLQDKINQGQQRQIVLQVGYGTNLFTILKGTVTQCYSVREGTNFVTTINALDLGFAYVNAQTNANFAPVPAALSQKSIIENLIASLGPYGVALGTVGDYPITTTRGVSYSGSTVQILGQITGGGFFIDNGKAHALNDDEALTTQPIPVINAQTGLLGTPIKEEITWKFDMLLEPALVIGQLIQIQSTANIANLQPTVDQRPQQYRIISLHHRGTISSAVCGDAITTVECQAGSFIQR